MTTNKNELLYTDEDMGKIIDERDYWHDKATELAEKYAIAAGIDVGEHSNCNCPVQNAIDDLSGFDPNEIHMPYE